MEYFDYKENIKEIGLIQDGCYVLSVQLGDGNEWKITSISDNIVNALWMKIDCVEDILGKNISDLFDSSSDKATIVRQTTPRLPVSTTIADIAAIDGHSRSLDSRSPLSTLPIWSILPV